MASGLRFDPDCCSLGEGEGVDSDDDDDDDNAEDDDNDVDDDSSRVFSTAAVRSDSLKAFLMAASSAGRRPTKSQD